MNPAPCQSLSTLRLFLYYVSAPVAHFVTLEMLRVDMLRFVALFAASRQRSFVSMFRMEMIVHVAVKVVRAMKPRANADKDAAVKPFRPIIPIRRAIVGGDVVVSIWTIRCNADLNAYLRRFCFGGRSSQPDSRSSG